MALSKRQRAELERQLADDDAERAAARRPSRAPAGDDADYDSPILVFSGTRADALLDRLFGGGGPAAPDDDDDQADELPDDEPDELPDDDADDDDEPDPAPPSGHKFFRR